MKKLIALIMVVAMAASLVACGNKAAVEKAPLEGTMEENAMKVMEIAPVEFMGGTIPVDLTDTSEDGKWAVNYFTGLNDASKITDVAVYESMMGSQAFSLVLVQVNDAAEAESVAREMKEKINPRKWICVEANDIKAAGCGDVVMFIMLDTQLGKTAQSFVDAFEKVCGKADFTI